MTVIIASMPVILSIPYHVDISTELLPTGEWKAIDRNTYDCDCDQDGFFEVCAVGHGDTEAAAIADLLDNMEDRT